MNRWPFQALSGQRIWGLGSIGANMGLSRDGNSIYSVLLTDDINSPEMVPVLGGNPMKPSGLGDLGDSGYS